MTDTIEKDMFFLVLAYQNHILVIPIKENINSCEGGCWWPLNKHVHFTDLLVHSVKNHFVQFWINPLTKQPCFADLSWILKFRQKLHTMILNATHKGVRDSSIWRINHDSQGLNVWSSTYPCLIVQVKDRSILRIKINESMQSKCLTVCWPIDVGVFYFKLHLHSHPVGTRYCLNIV